MATTPPPPPSTPGDQIRAAKQTVEAAILQAIQDFESSNGVIVSAIELTLSPGAVETKSIAITATVR